MAPGQPGMPGMMPPAQLGQFILYFWLVSLSFLHYSNSKYACKHQWNTYQTLTKVKLIFYKKNENKNVLLTLFYLWFYIAFKTWKENRVVWFLFVYILEDSRLGIFFSNMLGML